MASRTPYLTCREVVELATLADERALSLGERAHFQLHLGACADCRAYLTQLRGTRRACEVLAELSEPESTPPQLLERFRQWKNRGSS